MMSDRINVGSDSEDISSQDDQEEEDDIYSDHFEQSDAESIKIKDDESKTVDNQKKKGQYKRPKMQPLLISQKQSQMKSRNSTKGGGSKVGSRVSSGSTSNSPISRNGTLGSSRSDSLNSSMMSVVSLRKRTSYIQARINSAKKKSQTELINSMSALKIEIQDLSEENRNLRRLITRQEKELGKFVNTESDLPIILRAHNEETRVLKMKLKQNQDSNRSLAQNIKKKDLMIESLNKEVKELRKINKMEKLDEAYSLQEKLKEVTSYLQTRDNDYKELLKRQDILEKSFQQRMKNELRKQKALQHELKDANEKIVELEKSIYEKEKVIQRYNIYSGKKLRMKASKSEESLASDPQTEDVKVTDNFFKNLESKLKELVTVKKIEETQDEIESTANVGAVNDIKAKPEIVPESDHHEYESDSESQHSEASTAIQTGEHETEDKNTSPSMKDVSLSPREIHSKPEPDNTMDRVNLWLPLASAKGREIQISIDENQKAKLLAKLNEIDEDSDKDINRFSAAPVPNNNNNIEEVDKKKNLMEVLFGSKAEKSKIPKPLKTSLKTSPSSSSKSVTFQDEENKTNLQE